MGIVVVPGHIVVGVIPCHHHHGHQGHTFHTFLFQYGYHMLQHGHAFHTVHVDVAPLQFIQAVLDHGIERIGRMGRAVGHHQQRFVGGQVRELGGKGFHRFCHIVPLFLLSLPEQKRQTHGHLLELIAVVPVNAAFIVILHPGNDIQRSQGDPGIAFRLQLLQRFLRCGNDHAFFCPDAVDDNVGCIRHHHLHIRQRFLNFRYRSVNRLVSRFLHGGAEGHHHHGVLIGQVLHRLIVKHAHADLRRFQQGRRRILHFVAEFITGMARHGKGHTAGRQQHIR